MTAQPTGQAPVRTLSTGRMLVYASGEAATSLVINTGLGFAMFFYTQALGLSPAWAGLAMSISVFWDAIIDPVMGHVSDRTRSRWGRRHPYFLIGGVGMVVASYFVWNVPEYFTTSQALLFGYVLALQLAVRSLFAVWIIPYTALGFEICTDYEGRTRIQGYRESLNMLSNMAGTAIAWSFFFLDQTVQRDGKDVVVKGLSQPENYHQMGLWYGGIALFFVLFVTWATRSHIVDSRNLAVSNSGLGDFFHGLREMAKDGLSKWVIGFVVVVVTGVALTATLQVYTWDHYLTAISGHWRTLTHSCSIIGLAAGAFIASAVVRLMDKRMAVILGTVLNLVCNLLIAGLVLTGWFDRNGVFLYIAYTVLSSLYWVGHGIMVPVSTSMLADISEIERRRTGQDRDGLYASFFAFARKAGISAGLFLAGMSLTWIGFVEGPKVTQTPSVSWSLCALYLFLGPAISMVGVVLMLNYPVDKRYMDDLRKRQDS
ncbi:MFS transporter [Planctomycetota bacterium]|nr:MFS transporter [Planctomycetota bacterium]